MKIYYSLRDKLLTPRAVFVVWILATVVAILMNVFKTPNKYNNFMIFRGVADHFFASLPLYGPYPLEYGDLNHYGPLFAFIIAPFAAMPVWLGLTCWIAAMSMLLYLALRKLPVETRLQCSVLLLVANDLYCSALSQQFNIAVAALIIGTLLMIRQGREGWAALFIVIGAFTKLYGIVGLAFFFFVKCKPRFILHLILWVGVALLLPLLFNSPEYMLTQYVNWGADIIEKNGQNMFSTTTNISLLGVVRKISGSVAYSDLCLILPGICLFMLSYLRWKQFQYKNFQLLMLASVLLFVVLFSSGTENSGYVIASCGGAIWWVTLVRRGWLEWTLLVLMLFASYRSLFFPSGVLYDIFRCYALRAVPYFLIWAHCTYRLLRYDFGAEETEENTLTQ